MTNTHINVGGHKITTNEIGSVHYISPTNTSIGVEILGYVVHNRMCTITIWNLSISTTGMITITSGNIPKAKCNILSTLIDGNNGTPRGDVFIEGSSTLNAIVSTAGGYMYTSLTYPVADDWVES